MRVVPIFLALIVLQAASHAMADVPPARGPANGPVEYKDERVSFTVPHGAEVSSIKKGNRDTYFIRMPSRGEETCSLTLGENAETLENSRQRAEEVRKTFSDKIDVEQTHLGTTLVRKEVSKVTEYQLWNKGSIFAFRFKSEVRASGKVIPLCGMTGFGSFDGVRVEYQISGPEPYEDAKFMNALFSLMAIKKK